MDLDALDVGPLAGLGGSQEVALAHREGHVHRILADDPGKNAAFGADHVAFGQAGAPDLAGDGRRNVGVAEIDLRGFQVAIIGHDGPLRFSLLGDDFIQFQLSANVFFDQLLLPCPVLGR